MKTFLQRMIIFCLLITGIISKAQTNVSGGIFSNTTWTLANSPYIVVDTVVVFSGIKLSIEPGVTVKFENDKCIELRDAEIEAQGTIVDSITFTSNSSNPVIGSWGSIIINSQTTSQNQIFNFCNFRFAKFALSKENDDSIFIANSTFENNHSGVANNSGITCDNVRIETSIFKNNICGIGNLVNGHVWLADANIKNSSFINNQHTGMVIGYSKIHNCIISHNETGIYVNNGINEIIGCNIENNSLNGYYAIQGESDLVKNNIFRNNGIGIFDDTYQGYAKSTFEENIIELNTIGVKSKHINNDFVCNKICNNSDYNFYNSSNLNTSVGNNYWCTSDSATIQTGIYDAHVNVSSGIVDFLPLGNQCLLASNIADDMKTSFDIFPNPASMNFTVNFPENYGQTEISVNDILGAYQFKSVIISRQTQVDCSGFADGIYFVKITNGERTGIKKLLLKKR
jgi:hypothetical protein